MVKRNTYHSRGDFLWAKQEENETPEEHWKKLITLEKNCEFKDIKQEDLIISKFITSITDKKPREKYIREKTLNLKTTIELITQNSYDRRHKQSTVPHALAKDKEIKEEPIQKIQPKYKTDKHGNATQRKTTADSADNKIGAPNIYARQKLRNAITVRNEATSHEYAAANKTKLIKGDSTTWKMRAPRKKKANSKKSAK